MALAVAQVGGTSPPVNSVDSTTVTFGLTTVTNSLIVVVGCIFNISGSFAAGNCTDNKSNTYQLAGQLGTSTTECIALWYNNNGTRGATHQVTVNPPGASHSIGVGIVEITGQDLGSATSCFDATTFNTANDTASPFDVAPAAAIGSGQIAIYGVTVGGASGNPAITEPSGYSLISSFSDANTSIVYDVAYKIGETGTPTVGAAWSGTVGTESPKELIATFKAASTGPVPPPGSFVLAPKRFWVPAGRRRG